MPRIARATPGGYVYHVINRGVGRMPLFRKPADYDAFERVLLEALEKHPTRLLAYCLMPNHWHFVLWPKHDDDLTKLMRWLTQTHSQRWHVHHHRQGTGPLYQGRFKAFPIAVDDHFYRVVRYAERNALRAGLVRRAEEWRWSSLYHRLAGNDDPLHDWLHPWPVPMPRDWLRRVAEPETEAELAALRRSVQRGQPFGPLPWQQRVAKKLGLEFTLRQHEPKKTPAKDKAAGK